MKQLKLFLFISIILLFALQKQAYTQQFTEMTSIELTGVINSSVSWRDYDNDGDLDILITGTSAGNSVSKIYQNNGDNTFTEQSTISLTGVQFGSVAWGDYDNDGDLDILLTGDSEIEGQISKIYKNDGDNTFTEQTSISLPGIQFSSVVWGDYDNDGDLDILITGWNEAEYTRIAKIYKNNGDNAFIEQTSISLTDVYISSVAWGDYDNDGDLDILLTGSTPGFSSNSKIYRNNSATANTAPQSPTNLTETTNYSQATLSWDAAIDTETPSAGLTYNVFVCGVTDTIVMPHSNPVTGYVKKPAMGNAQLGTNFIVKELSHGIFYWKVQAVDNCFAGGAFSEEKRLFVGKDYGYVEINTSENATWTIDNPLASGNFEITDVYTNNTIFTPDITTASITQGYTTTVTLTCTPITGGEILDTLYMETNDPSYPIYKFPIKATGSTYPCGDGVVISTNTTWTQENSPYCIDCANTTVMSEVTLTIEAGVNVIFSENSKLSINGTLDAQGSISDSRLPT